MYLRSLTVKNLRVHSDISVQFSPITTLITGKNGSGKTSIMEAVYIALRGKSFKDTDDAILSNSSDWYRIDLSTTDGDRTTVYDVRTDRKKKTHTVDGKDHLRMPERVKYPIILFEPDDMQMITGSPSRRRRYMDTLITQYDSQYASAMRRYERALIQRNKLLKQPHSRDELFAWNVSLSRYGAEIIAARQAALHYINERLNDTYRVIAGVSDDIAARYTINNPVTAQHLLAELEVSYQRDIYTGTTTVGPHRHDLHIIFNDKPANQTGSRGELRTIILALKFIEAALVQEKTEKRPIILLDDVFSELDIDRQRCLLSEFHDNQVIITSASAVSKKGIVSTISL